jgi:hypothetical protein
MVLTQTTPPDSTNLMDRLNWLINLDWVRTLPRPVPATLAYNTGSNLNWLFLPKVVVLTKRVTSTARDSKYSNANKDHRQRTLSISTLKPCSVYILYLGRSFPQTATVLKTIRSPSTFGIAKPRLSPLDYHHAQGRYTCVLSAVMTTLPT